MNSIEMRNIIEEVVNKFSKDKVIFLSEAQFQFKLAWELQKKLDEIDKDSYEVLLEEKLMEDSFLKTNSKNTNIDDETNSKKTDIRSFIKRSYTDIFIKPEDKDIPCYAIELKYKTKKLTDNNTEKIILLEQGAQDLGRYDFLWDINRLETLIYKNEKVEKERELLKNCIEDENEKEKYKDNNYIKEYSDYNVTFSCDINNIIGYAIMLTNDSSYWSTYIRNNNEKQQKNNNIKYFRKDCISRDFCIAHNTTIIKNTPLKWIPKATSHPAILDKWRARPIRFINTYTFTWKPYLDLKPKQLEEKNLEEKNYTGGTEFQYTIVEVKKNEK